MMTRALIAARLSRKQRNGDEGIGLHTQDERSRQFCERMGWEVVGAARDTITGAKAPMDRRELGPWVTDPAKVALYDVIVAYKTDRLSRGDDTDWSRIETWAADHGKTLVIVDGSTGVRYPARDDSDYWQWQATKRQAGRERADIRERITRAQCRIMRDDAWVGRAPFGYVIEGDKYGKSLAANEKLVSYVEEIFDRVTKGESLRVVAAWLTAENVPTERGNAVWNEGAVRQIVTNETYTGSHTRGCADCGGSHVLPVPAIVDMATQARAVAALKARRRGYSGGGRPSEAPAMLTPTCDRCGIPMYRGGAVTSRGYYCKTRTAGGVRVGCGQSVRAAWLDTEVDVWIGALQKDETVLTVTYPAAALESEIEGAKRAQRAAYDVDDMDAMMEHRATVKALEAKLAVTERERVERVPTSRTLGQVWTSLGPAERRAWLRSQGITVRVFPPDSPYSRYAIEFDWDVA